MSKSRKTHWYSNRKRGRGNTASNNRSQTPVGRGVCLNELEIIQREYADVNRGSYMRRRIFCQTSYVFFALLAMFMVAIASKLSASDILLPSFIMMAAVSIISVYSFIRTDRMDSVAKTRCKQPGDYYLWEHYEEEISFIKEKAVACYACIFPLWLKMVAPSISWWIIVFIIAAVLIMGAFDVVLATIQLVGFCISIIVCALKGKSPFNLSE